jgi:hypothetical protein
MPMAGQNRDYRQAARKFTRSPVRLRTSCHIRAVAGLFAQYQMPACISHWRNCGSGNAPDMRCTSLPPLNTNRVGILRIANCWAMPGLASVSNFAKRARGSHCAAAWLNTGPKVWQGPHQGAQQSITTGISFFSRVAEKLVGVSVSGLRSNKGCLHLPQLGLSSRRSAGKRFVA